MNDQVTKQETETILNLAEKTLGAEGDFVELGCYKGDTSVLLGKLLQKTDKNLWVYDSFAGLPEKTAEDASGAGKNFQAGELFVTKREVVDKLRRAGLKIGSRPPEPTNPTSHIIIKKAWFDDLNPATDLPEEIAFAFLDGDLYSSIKVSLKLVAPKMAQNGIIIVHDYNNSELPGSSRAVDEFLRAHPEKSLSVRHSLAIIV